MLQTKSEIRTNVSPVRFREATQEQKDNGIIGVIEGLAIPFNKTSKPVNDWGDDMYEVILPSCCTQEFLDSQDIKLNMYHKRGNTFARCNHGKGSMRVTSREDGVYFEADVPDCELGKQAVALIKNDVIIGCSFEFVEKDYSIAERKREKGGYDVVITHSSFDTLSALSLALDPCYSETTINVREQVAVLESKREDTKLDTAAKAYVNTMSMQELEHQIARMAALDNEVL